MYPHQTERLTTALEPDGFEALIATTPANVGYVTGFRSLSKEVDPATEVLAVFTRRGIALVVPALDAPAVAVEPSPVDHVVCYGAPVYEVGEPRDEGARPSRPKRLPARSARSASGGGASGSTRTERSAPWGVG
jgi:Xaa-Pro aminopeptidase